MILEWLGLLTQRPIIIALAVVGAVLATLGVNSVAYRLRIGPHVARWLLRCGYGAVWTSVILFVVAGFLPV